MSSHAPAEAPPATAPVAAHNQKRWILAGGLAALALLAAGAFVLTRGHDAGAIGNATVIAAPTTGIIATMPPDMPTPTPLATAPPTTVPTQPPPTAVPTQPPPTVPPTAQPTVAPPPAQPLVAPAPKPPPAAPGPGRGKGKGKDDRKGGD